MVLHEPKNQGEHVEDYIERMAALDSQYAIAHAILVHGRTVKVAVDDLRDDLCKGEVCDDDRGAIEMVASEIKALSEGINLLAVNVGNYIGDSSL